MGGLGLEGCARCGGGDGDVDFWSGVVAEVKEEVRDAGEGGAFFEEVVLGFDFGGPFIICDGQLGPF